MKPTVLAALFIVAAVLAFIVFGSYSGGTTGQTVEPTKTGEKASEPAPTAQAAQAPAAAEEEIVEIPITISCDDGDPTTNDHYDEATGRCTFTPK